ncbi:GNAT family N-acetyltransferase [Planococcus shenhongbingii]|uniref:GNAT family N-acetyltransferase n=1 Tax=Planococcus shenhongbingii TaxID=3058398 RepID=UPI002616A0E0|nr:GNAT family N-acetyltransferase [Planococcus sp. N016]WKA58356.1 GNAT family N-acetyltransferase [Planococcus sp. N016]
MQIRKATKEDIKHVAKIYVDSWRTTYRGLVPDEYLAGLSYEEAQKNWNDFLIGGNEAFIYVAIDDRRKIIGFASGKRIEEKNFDGELYSLYLLQECRGLGAGKRLVSAIAKHFQENGIHSMMVWVMKQNKSGLGFYERIGGKEYNHRTSSFGGTEVRDVSYGWHDLPALYVK